METPAILLRKARAESGLSVRALASLGQVSPNTVMQIEKGRVDPSFGTLTKLLRAAGYELVGSLHRRRNDPTVTIEALADAHEGAEPDWTRLRGTIDWLRDHPWELPAALKQRPASTGWSHLDALLAGIADKLADDAHLHRAAWTKHIPSPEATWTPDGTPRMRQRWAERTPAQLKSRNLVVDEESLWRREVTRA